MTRCTMRFIVMLTVCFWTVTPVRSASIPIENASFEAPFVDPNGFGALPIAEGWTEIDVDTLGSTNTGVFANTAEGNPDHVNNADGSQLAFLGSEQGNAFQQDLDATYKAACEYELTVAVGISMRFPPSREESPDTIELALYYLDESGSVVDIARETVMATGLSTTDLLDFSVTLPKVDSADEWAGKAIGVAIRAAGSAGGFWTLDHVRLVESLPASIPIANASFESPVVDPNGFGALPIAEGWTEIDIDSLGSTNTGVFANTALDSPDHVNNADGNQMAFIGSEQGNVLQQDLAATYKAGCEYQLSAAVGISMRFPPSNEEPADSIELVLYYIDETDSVVDVARETVEATGLSTTDLLDFSVSLPKVDFADEWAGKAIGIAIRATGLAGGFWTLDNVRLTELMPTSIPIENASFEVPQIDPNAFAAWPVADGWIESDVDTLSSSNTGVFANTPIESWDHVDNADGFQLAFLGSESGNAFEQDLPATYTEGCDYRLTVAVGVSSRYPPSIEVPLDTLELALYYYDETNSIVDIAAQAIEGIYLSSGRLQDFSVYVPSIQSTDTWAGKTIGIAIRAAGMPGGFWILDSVRLAETLPVPDIENSNKE
jgi:uncharacterized protein YlxP (DUF503 family)